MEMYLMPSHSHVRMSVCSRWEAAPVSAAVQGVSTPGPPRAAHSTVAGGRKSFPEMSLIHSLLFAFCCSVYLFHESTKVQSLLVFREVTWWPPKSGSFFPALQQLQQLSNSLSVWWDGGGTPERFPSPLQQNLKSITHFLFVLQLGLQASCITQRTSPASAWMDWISQQLLISSAHSHTPVGRSVSQTQK